MHTHWVYPDRSPAAIQETPTQVVIPVCSNWGYKTEIRWQRGPPWFEPFILGPTRSPHFHLHWHPSFVRVQCLYAPCLLVSAPEQLEAWRRQFGTVGSHEPQGLPDATGRHAAGLARPRTSPSERALRALAAARVEISYANADFSAAAESAETSGTNRGAVVMTVTGTTP